MLKTKEEIENWLSDHFIEDYIINSDLTVDVNRHVVVSDRNIKEFPIQFGTIRGAFICNNNNNLKSLKGCPYYVEGAFSFIGNQISNFEFAPKFVNHDFLCAHNPLTTMEGFNTDLKGNFLHGYTKNETLPIKELNSYYNEIDIENNMSLYISAQELKHILSSVRLHEDLSHDLSVKEEKEKNKLKL